jgi:alpha-galactosidase
VSYEIIEGKHPGEGLPTTHGKAGDVTSLKVYLKDEVNDIEVTLHYAVFHKLDAITRSFELVNKGKEEIVVERAESFCVDLPRAESDWEMVGLHGDWAREGRKFRRKIDWGTQGYVLLHSQAVDMWADGQIPQYDGILFPLAQPLCRTPGRYHR